MANKELDIFACIVALLKAFVNDQLDAVDDDMVENCIEEVVNNHGFMTGGDLLGDFNSFAFNASMLNMIIHSVYNNPDNNVPLLQNHDVNCYWLFDNEGSSSSSLETYSYADEFYQRLADLCIQFMDDSDYETFTDCFDLEKTLAEYEIEIED